MPLSFPRAARLVPHAIVLATLATLAATSGRVLAAENDDSQVAAQAFPPIPLPPSVTLYANGFADLKAALDDAGLGELAGLPVTPEQPGDLPDTVIQLTSTRALFYWAPGSPPSFTTDAVHRWALVEGRGLVAWEGEALKPPPPPPPAPARYTGHDPAGYIAAHSRYGQRAVCVSSIETGGWTAFYNSAPWGGGQHAQGFFGWLPSTWNGLLDPRHPQWGTVGQGGSIMDLDAEINGFDRMLDDRRGGEFAGIAAGVC